MSLQPKTNFSKMCECFFICLIERHRRKTWNFKSKKFLKNKFFIKYRQLLSLLCFSEIFCQKPVLIGKQLCWSFFFTKITGSAPVTFLKSDSRTSAFSDFYKIFIKDFWMATSDFLQNCSSWNSLSIPGIPGVYLEISQTSLKERFACFWTKHHKREN